MLEGEVVVWRLPVDEPPPLGSLTGPLVALVRTATELSGVSGAAPAGAAVEPGWAVLQVEGPLDFGLTGVLASLAQPLAAAGVPIFAVSTYDTDHVLVPADRLLDAVEALRAAGHTVEGGR